MGKKSDKNNTDSRTMVQFISEKDATSVANTAIASLLLNPAVTWAKFILTDDLPNGNNMRIPYEEFDNIIRTGVYMPVKMAEGKIEEGHEDSKPIGVITHLKKESTESGNALIALAALWGFERPADIEYIRSIMEESGDVNVSWEISFGEREIEEGGVQSLRDVILNAVTLVTRPAYQGRTKFLAVAAKASPWSEAFIEELPDSSFLYIEDGGEKDSEGKTTPRNLRRFAIKDATGLIEPSRLQSALAEIEESDLSDEDKEGALSYIKSVMSELDSGKSAQLVSFGEEQSEKLETEDTLETLEQLKAELDAKKTELESAKASLDELNEKLENVEKEASTLKEEMEVLNSELEELRGFKSEIEEKAQREEKLLAIKEKFTAAGIEKDDEYFTESGETLLKMTDEDLEFLLQELSSFAKLAEASLGKKTIPNLNATGDKTSLSAKELAKALKEKRAK